MAATFALSLLAGAAACPPAWAGRLAVQVVDQSGQPVSDAVVALQPDAQPPSPPAPQGPPASAVLDQQHETFIPLVTLLRVGGALTVRNSDSTRHHVYSFSAIKQFQFALDPGDQSPPVVFDKPGLAAIGCNIHDHMIAYVYAAASPWTAVSDQGGHVNFEAVPAGRAELTVWHPALTSGAKPLTQQITLETVPRDISVKITLTAHPAAMSHKSMDY